MKNQQLLSVLTGLALLSACSSDLPDDSGNQNPTGGTGGMNAGTSGSNAGGAGTSPGTGGSTSPTAGTTSTGGSGTAGTAPTAGSTSSGGTATGGTGSGGTPAGGTGGGSTGGTGGGSGGATKWVATWAASPYLAASDAQPPSALSNAVLRQVTHVSLGGSKIRVQFSNLVGDGAVNIKSAHIAISGSQTQADGTINATTDKAITFSSMETVTIAAKMEVWSDPIDFTMMPLANVSITTALGSVPTSLTAHAGSRTTSYVVANSTAVNGASLTGAQTTDHWYFISGIDVMAPETAGAAVAIGDSITDGRGTDTNKNNRWTDILSARLQANPATANVAMINQGIGATNLIGGGTGAETRFARDVLAQSGVKYAIVLDGVNDIHGGASADAMKAVYAKLISAAKAKQVKIYGATILPFGGSADYYSANAETTRVAVNTYIKSGVFDGVIDFDAAMTDGGTPPKLPDALAAWSQKDGLHPGPAGYQKMGETPDLMLFTK